MTLEHPLLFFFSTIGAFNGLFLSMYFAFFIKNRSRATNFLAAFLFVVSLRIVKSVFLYFYPHISELFIQTGLLACSLIGPFLYLYISVAVKHKRYQRYTWLYHVLPGLLFVFIFMQFFPYWQHRKLYSTIYFKGVLYTYWISYVVLSAFLLKDSFKKLFKKSERLTDVEVWRISLVVGITLIWAAYNFSQYTSYISGAVSFSFIFYLLLLLWAFKRRKTSVFFEKPLKYSNKKISGEEAERIACKLNNLFTEKELYKNPNLKLPDVADELLIPSHYLSQYLNDNLGKSFSTFINAYRIMAVEEMLKTNKQFTLEAIGYECGFKSNSSFYSAFKKEKGITPAQYKKAVD